MEKLIKWITIHKKQMIILIIAIIILPMIVIHFLFKIKTNCYWIQAEWDAGEVLGYFGDILSFIGTVILGYIAIAQTEKANQLNEELVKIEKNRIKPCLEISSMQSYKIFMAEDMYKKLDEIYGNAVMQMNLLYTSHPRTGIETNSVLIELEVCNSGFSDIRRIFVKNLCFYLAVNDPYNSENEKIACMSGDTCLKVGESKKLYICIKREISCDEELSNEWYIENIDNLMPHMEFEFMLETAANNRYIEKISCGSNWNNKMISNQGTTTRTIGIYEISVHEK